MRLTAGLAVLAVANVLVLVGTQAYVISVLGATRATDALFAGMALPQVILMIVSGSLGNVLVPLFVTTDQANAQREGWGLLVAVIGAFAGLVAALHVTARFWVPILVPGFSASDRALTISLTQIQLVSVVLTAGASVLTAFAQAKRRFLWAESAPLIGGLSGLGAIVYLLGPYGVAAAAWTTVLRAFLHFVCLLPLLGRWRRPHWQSPVLAEAWKRARPLLAGTCYYKIDPLVDRLLASMSPAGSLSLLLVGQQFYSAGSQVITRAMVVPIVPKLADHASRGLWGAFKSGYRRLLFVTACAVTAAALVLLVQRGLVTRLLASLGGLDSANAAMFWKMLLGLLGIFIGGCLGQITSTAFYAMGDTKTPTKIGAWLFTLYIPAKCLSFLLFGLMGMIGSISAYYTAAVVVQLAVLERTVRRRTIESEINGRTELVSR